MHPPERRLDRLERLERVILAQSHLVQSDLDIDGFAQRVVEHLRELTQAEGVTVELVDGEDTVCFHACGAVAPRPGRRLARAGSLSGLCVRTGAMVSCADTEADPRVDRQAARGVGARSMICTPLFRAGHAIGLVKVLYARPHAFDAGDVPVLSLMASTLAGALGQQMAIESRSRVEARLRANEERMRSMLEHAHDAVVSMDDAGCVSQWNRAAERLFGWAPIEAMGQPLAELIVPPAQRGEFGRIVAGFAASERLEDVHQRVTVAAVDRAGRELAVEVSLTATRVDGRWELTAFGRDVSERRHLEARLRELALSDGLTGLANRRAFMEALEKAVARAQRLGHRMALLFLDLDDFKQINDEHGHHVGDLALQAFARRIEQCVRKGDVVARLGGDEFTVLAEGVDSLEQAQAIAAKIGEAMQPPIEHGLRLRASIGVSLYRAPADASQFLRDADHAMYLAKRGRPSGRADEPDVRRAEALFD
ncbi:MAG: diguanylate cyclase domain-containing protein [Burkholderiaceae bacterium]